MGLTKPATDFEQLIGDALSSARRQCRGRTPALNPCKPLGRYIRTRIVIAEAFTRTNVTLQWRREHPQARKHFGDGRERALEIGRELLLPRMPQDLQREIFEPWTAVQQQHGAECRLNVAADAP